MIAIVSSVARERAALAALCDSQGWVATDCDSARGFARLIHRISPKVVVVRHKLDDGYSDDVIAALATWRMLPAAKVIVLAGAAMAASVEMRQITIGADCVQRDPVRTDILLAYLGKYLTPSPDSGTEAARRMAKTIAFSGATLNALDRMLYHGKKSVLLTPREVTLTELLADSAGTVVTYDTLYSVVLDRRFRGDTSNMRVLLGKLGASAHTIGIALRQWVEVIPKSGYRYKGRAANGSRPLPSVD